MAQDLVDTLRLSVVELRYRMPLSLAVGELRDLPPPASSSTVRVSIKLLGFNDAMASYHVRFFEGSLALTDTPLTVRRGKQAVVGGLDGEHAPYLFLLIAPAGSEPAQSSAPAGPVDVDGDIQPPLVIEATPATYPREARQEEVEGVVLVKTIIEKDGKVSDVRVLEGLPHGLSEAAVEAIKQWRFEPALMDGEPIAVYYDLTVNFRLPPDEESEREP
ncbi:MAG: energy transducer TonB [bacterium]|nr:energy transducer TonB [bacterium]